MFPRLRSTGAGSDFRIVTINYNRNETYDEQSDIGIGIVVVAASLWIGMGVILMGVAVAGLEPLVRKIPRPLPAESV